MDTCFSPLDFEGFRIEATPSQPDLSRLRIDRSSRQTASPWGMAPKLILIVFLGAAAWLWWQNRDQSQSQPTTPKETSTLVAVEYDDSAATDGVSGNGYVIARRRAALSTVLSGRLVEIHVEEGSRVKKGEIVARIQFDDYANALAESRTLLLAAKSKKNEIAARHGAAATRVSQAEANFKVNGARVATIRTDLAEAIRNRERNRKSYLEKDISEALWDELITRVERLEKQLTVALAELAQVKTSIKTAQADLEAIAAEYTTQDAAIERVETQITAAAILLEKTYIRAPFDGIIVNKGAEEGEVVAATGAGGNSRGSVATLVDFDTLEVQVELPEVRLGKLRDGQFAEIYLDVASRVAWPGHIRQIWPTADRGKGTVEIRIVFDKRPEQLRPEMGARVVFLDGSKGSKRAEKTLVIPKRAEKTLVIPKTSVVAKLQERFVWVVENNRLAKRPVMLGADRGKNVVIEKGLKIGEKVVDRPASRLREGENFPHEQ